VVNLNNSRDQMELMIGIKTNKYLKLIMQRFQARMRGSWIEMLIKSLTS